MIDFFSIWTQLASRKATGNTSAPALRLWVVKLCLIESECYKNLNTGNIIQTNLQFSDILLPPRNNLFNRELYKKMPELCPDGMQIQYVFCSRQDFFV